ncbi:MAG: DUF4270 family protein [Cyclobacteriaceae bacterium]|nr:DUF4270 family protein [Cyclobacteriaceae bacterium]
MLSCTDDAALIGYRKESRSAIRYVEIPLNASVLLHSPLSTRNTLQEGVNRLLVGHATDPTFGHVEAKSYFNFSPPVQWTTPAPDAVFESLELQLKFDYYAYGPLDNSAVFLEVYEIVDQLNSSVEYYNTTPVNLGATAVADTLIELGADEIRDGWAAYIDNTAANDAYFTLTIKLNSTYGLNLFNDLLNDQAVFSNFSTFTSRYPGFAVTSPSASKILGIAPVYSLPTPSEFDSKVILKYKEGANVYAVDYPIYYTILQVSEDKQEVFPSISFSGIEADWSSTPLSGIVPFEDFHTVDGNLPIQSGTGLMTKLDLTPVFDYFDSLDVVVINSAEFIMENISSTKPPQKIQLAILDSINGFRPIYLDTLINNQPVYDPYLRAIQLNGGVNLLTVNIDETRAVILNELSGNSVFVDQGTGKIDPIIVTEFFQQLLNLKTSSKRAKSIAVYPIDMEFQKSVSSLLLDPSSAKLRVYYTKPLTAIP